MRKKLLYILAALVLVCGVQSTIKFSDGDPFPRCGLPGLPPCR